MIRNERKNDEMATKFKWRVIFNKVFHLISNPRRNNRRLKLQRAIATQLIHFFFLVSDNWFVCMIPNEVASSMQSFLSNLSLLPNYLPNIFNFPSDFLLFFKFMFSHSKYNYTLRWLSFGFSYRFFKNSITFIIFLSEMCFLLCLL